MSVSFCLYLPVWSSHRSGSVCRVKALRLDKASLSLSASTAPTSQGQQWVKPPPKYKIPSGSRSDRSVSKSGCWTVARGCLQVLQFLPPDSDTSLSSCRGLWPLWPTQTWSQRSPELSHLQSTEMTKVTVGSKNVAIFTSCWRTRMYHWKNVDLFGGFLIFWST